MASICYIPGMIRCLRFRIHAVENRQVQWTQNIRYCLGIWILTKGRVCCHLSVLQSPQAMSKFFYQAHLTRINPENPQRRYCFLDF